MISLSFNFFLWFESTGKRIISLTVDGEFVYWIIATKDNTQIYQAEKGSGVVVSQVKASGSKHILAYSSVLQPFPGNRVVLTTHSSPSPRLSVSSVSVLGSCFCPTLCQHAFCLPGNINAHSLVCSRQH